MYCLCLTRSVNINMGNAYDDSIICMPGPVTISPNTIVLSQSFNDLMIHVKCMASIYYKTTFIFHMIMIPTRQGLPSSQHLVVVPMNEKREKYLIVLVILYYFLSLKKKSRYYR
jgi:hypothetical protein